MSALSIVAISAFSVLFLLLLLAAAGAIVYTQLLVRRQITEFALLLRDSGTKIDSNYARMEALVGTINGQKIAEAANQFLEQIPRQAQTALRIEKALNVYLDTLRYVMDEQGIPGSAIERARASGLEPESYAPAAPGERFVSQSRTSLGDTIANESESESNTQSFNEGE